MLQKTDDYFLAIVKYGKLSRVAEMLFVTQPSLTKYVKRLEARLGTELFNHNSSPLRLTEAGKVYYEYLLSEKQREDDLRTHLDEIKKQERGILKIGIPPFCGRCYLPRILPGFINRYPNVKLELIEGTGMSLEQALLDGTIDIAVAHLPLNHLELIYEELMNEHILFVTRNPNRDSDATTSIKDGDISTLIQFSAQNFFLPNKDQKIWKRVQAYFNRIDFRPHTYLCTESIETILALVKSDIGVGFIPESGLYSISETHLPFFHFYRLGHELEAWKIVAVRRKGYTLPSYTRYFLDLFKAIKPTV